MSLDTLRGNFRPRRIRLLIVAESPPPRIGFFYDVQAREGALSRATRQALERVLRTCLTRAEFLDAFRRHGCFLYDMFNQRGKTVHAASKSERLEATRNLEAFLRKERPEDVVSVLRRIDALVRPAVEALEQRPDYTNLPYPNRQWIATYRDGLESVFRKLLEGDQAA